MKRSIYTALVIAVTAHSAFAVDQNGVSPTAISLPSGPGSIQGLGESYQPQLNSGSGTYSVPLKLPAGPGGIKPSLTLSYNSGGGSSAVGLGWSISGLFRMCRNTDNGVPYYTDGADGEDDDRNGVVDNPEEIDRIQGIDSEELVELPGGILRAENESAFFLYERSGDGFVARSKDGSIYEFGISAAARIESDGKIFEWCLERMRDKNGNEVVYTYMSDPVASAQKYIRKIEWGSANAGFAVVFQYEEGRPDVVVSYRSGFEVRTSLRMSRIDVVSRGVPVQSRAVESDFDGDGTSETLVRRYELTYDAEEHVSLLTRVRQIGNDGRTALPALTMDYTRWSRPDSVAGTLVRSSGAPSVAFESASAELIDLNSDGLPDLLSTQNRVHRVALNRGVREGRLVWGPLQPVGNAPAIDIATSATTISDSTGDGLSDISIKMSESRFVCFDNTGEAAWADAGVPLRRTDTFPIWPFDGDGGAASRSIDCDYNRCNDVLFTSATGYRLWMLLPGGQYAKELRIPPLVCDGKVFRFDQLGTQAMDLNGDRTTDLVWIQNSRLVYWPNHGRGVFGEPLVRPLGRTLTNTDIQRAGFSDIDGDGLVDFTVVRPASAPGSVLYWLNRFDNGFDGPFQIDGLPAAQSGDALRWADMNGNGSTDIVISSTRAAAGERISFVELVPEGKPYLLRRVENGLGLVMTMDYETSVDHMVRADAEGNPWSVRMPMSMPVVSRVAEDDSRGNVYQRVISYRDPHYDAAKQEFRGFERATQVDVGDASIDDKVVSHTYDTGRTAACLKGKPLVVETTGGDGTVLTRIENVWSNRVLGLGIDAREVCYAFQERADHVHVEGSESPIRTRVETEWDDFGNNTRQAQLGRTDRSGDEIIVERQYELRESKWQMDLVAIEVTKNGGGETVKECRFDYDDSGNLLRKDAFLDTENRFVPVERHGYDEFGNPVESRDANGNRRTMQYDELIHAAVVRETVHLDGPDDLVSTADYDLGLGVMIANTDFSEQRTTYDYDALGRLLTSRAPGGTGEDYQYVLANPISHVVKRVRENASGATYDSFSYTDGYGRPLGTKVESEGDRWRYMEVKRYNARKLEAESWLPYFTASPDFEQPDAGGRSTLNRFDALGRLVEVTNPDGSSTATRYDPLSKTLFDENDTAGIGQPTTVDLDGLNRIVATTEREGNDAHVSRYTWNARNELTSVIDALGNERRLTFDSLGRLVEIDDPDRGRTIYDFDDAGNRIRREDARGQVTVWTYDSANRTLTEDHVESGPARVEVTFHYDAPAGVVDFGDGTSGTARNVRGRLAWIEDLSGEEHFSFDARGNEEWTVKRVRDKALGVLVSYRTQREYDLMNRGVGVVYPDGDRIELRHNEGSYVDRIGGDAGGVGIVDSVEYAATGQLSRVVCANGAVTEYTYDERDRLELLRTRDAAGNAVIERELTYDPASNVAAVTDLRSFASAPAGSPRRATVAYTYDDLHRLVEARYGRNDDANANLGQIDWSYDALGNTLAQTTPALGVEGHLGEPNVGLGEFSYRGGRSQRVGADSDPGPHAVTATASGIALSYDDSGNIARKGTATLQWDYEDRLQSFTKETVRASFLYDATDRRVVKSTENRRVARDAHYVNEWFEVRDGMPIKYVVFEGKRIAKVTGMLSPQRDRVQSVRLAAGWTSLSAAVETSQTIGEAFGSGVVAVEMRGREAVQLASTDTVPFAKALWIHSPSARIAAFVGKYPETLPDTTTGGGVHAWPRLEPFDPRKHLAAPGKVHVYDAVRSRWLLRDPSLPIPIADLAAGESAPGATTFSASGPRTVRPSATVNTSVVHYHADHLCSTAVTTDRDGVAIEEIAYYPFGEVRHVHRPGSASEVGGQPESAPYTFTGKERDRETGLHYSNARYLDAVLGTFASPDPRFVEVAALANGSEEDKKSLQKFLANPQMNNVYAYGLRNPAKLVDPSGFEPAISPALRDSPGFMKAWNIFKKTERGSALIAGFEKRGMQISFHGGKLGDGMRLGDRRDSFVGVYWGQSDFRVDLGRTQEWLRRGGNRPSNQDVVRHIAQDIAGAMNDLENATREDEFELDHLMSASYDGRTSPGRTMIPSDQRPEITPLLEEVDAAVDRAYKFRNSADLLDVD